jgi:hypothetical protein
VRLTFDSNPVTDAEQYTPYRCDIPTTATIYFRKPWVGAERDYGHMQPDPGVDTGNYPDIVVPPTEGPQGGNAFFTCLGDVGNSQQHVGWYITDSSVPPVTGDFTAEAVFMLAKIGTTSDPVVDSEYSLHNIFGTEMISRVGQTTQQGPAWKFRVWPIGIIGGDGKLQLWTGDTNPPDTGENDVDGPPLSIDTWYHAACVYTQSTNTIELFLDGVSQGSTNPDWPTTIQDDWWVGAWPSNGANRGLAGWIDAVALSDEALIPTNFVLPNNYPCPPILSVNYNWSCYE